MLNTLWLASWVASVRGRVEGRKERQGDRENEKERERERRTQNTHALAQATLKITIGSLARVQAGAFKALAGFAPTKNLPNF